jgi:hypothetical protein
MRSPTTPCLLILFAIAYSNPISAQEGKIGPDASLWPVHITHDPDYVSTDHPSIMGDAILELACNKDHGQTLAASLYGYKGNKLERIPDIDRPAYFVIMTADGQVGRFPVVIHYDAPGKAWALGSDLPPDFLQMLVSGSALVLENAEFDQILVFDLLGFESFRSAAARVCAIPVSTFPVSTFPVSKSPASTPPPGDVTAALRTTSQTNSSASLCSPKTPAARILAKPARNAVHPHWRGDNFVGTGWTFTPRQMVTNTTGSYARGDLHGSRGGVVDRDIFVLLSEWECKNSQLISAGPDR